MKEEQHVGLDSVASIVREIIPPPTILIMLIIQLCSQQIHNILGIIDYHFASGDDHLETD